MVCGWNNHSHHPQLPDHFLHGALVTAQRESTHTPSLTPLPYFHLLGLLQPRALGRVGQAFLYSCALSCHRDWKANLPLPPAPQGTFSVGSSPTDCPLHSSHDELYMFNHKGNLISRQQNSFSVLVKGKPNCYVVDPDAWNTAPRSCLTVQATSELCPLDPTISQNPAPSSLQLPCLNLVYCGAPQLCP